MTKKILRDILPPPDKSIRKIPLPENRSRPVPVENARHGEKEANQEKDLQYPPNKNKRNWVRFLLWIIIVSFVVIFIIIPSIWSSAEIKIKTKTIDHNFNKELIAGTNISEGMIPFDIINFSKEDEKELEATGEEDVEKRASGEIIIFNKFSENNQNLIRNTRFETIDGLIYKINESVTIPGLTIENGEIIPGQLSVKVYAEFPGEEYNIGLADFTIPGFKGMPQFEDFFARSDENMTGGFIGKVGTISDESLEKTMSELRSNLENSIREEILAEVPEAFILLPQSLKIFFESKPEDNPNKTTVVMVKEKGTATGIVLNRKSLEEKIITDAINSKPAEALVSNLETLSFTIDNIDETKIEDLDSFDFNMIGKAKIVWTFDEEELKNNMMGKSKKEIENILSTQYPYIEEASITIKPFWKRSIPKDIKKIEIINENS